MSLHKSVKSMEASGSSDPMLHGLSGSSAKANAPSTHPIQASEKAFEALEHLRGMDELRRNQGVHAPLKINMERSALSKVGHLPIISQRHNLLDDVITGRDETITPRDLFGKPEDHDGLSNPHAVLEKHFKML